MKNIKAIFIILTLLITSNAIFAQDKQQANKKPTPRELRENSPQDNVKTQPLQKRENTLYQESLRAINKNKNKYMHDLPKEHDNWDQYGIKKRFYFKFLFGIGWSLLDDYTDTCSYHSTDTVIIGDFSFMAIFKPTRKRSGRQAVGYGFEFGLLHLTKATHMNNPNKTVSMWGMPINLVFQIPLYKFFSRTQDLFLIFGPGIYIPVINDDHRIHMSFVLGGEVHVDLGGKIIMPIFLKTRFIFHGYHNENDHWVKNFYWIIEAGVGISF